MFAFITFIGIVCLLALLTYPLWKTFLPKQPPAALAVLEEKKKRWLFTAFALILALTNWIFFYSSPGYQYFLVYPWGHKSGVMSEGVKFAPFATKQEWNKNIDIKTVAIDPKHQSDFNSAEGIEELEGVMNPIDLRFIDQVTGTMNVTTRFQIPQEELQFIEFAIKYRNITNLVHNTLIPTISEQGKNTGYMHSAQDYISGAAQGFKQTFEEQLENGAYVVNKVERPDTVWDENITTDKKRHIKEIQTIYSVEKVLDAVTHKPRVIPNEISISGIKVSQVIVDNVIVDQEYQDRLKDQKGESAKRQLEQQKIVTARVAQQRVIAEGEQAKAAERVAQEVEQVKTLIPYETQREKEKALLAAAQIANDRAQVEARTLLTTEKAQADANALKVRAGLTPQERAEWDYKTATGVAEKIAGPNGLTLPTTYIGGGAGQGKESLLETLIGADLARQMLNRKNNP